MTQIAPSGINNIVLSESLAVAIPALVRLVLTTIVVAQMVSVFLSRGFGAKLLECEEYMLYALWPMSGVIMTQDWEYVCLLILPCGMIWVLTDDSLDPQPLFEGDFEAESSLCSWLIDSGKTIFVCSLLILTTKRVVWVWKAWKAWRMSASEKKQQTKPRKCWIPPPVLSPPPGEPMF